MDLVYQKLESCTFNSRDDCNVAEQYLLSSEARITCFVFAVTAILIVLSLSMQNGKVRSGDPEKTRLGLHCPFGLQLKDPSRDLIALISICINDDCEVD